MIRRYTPAIIVASLLFLVSSLPPTSVPSLGIRGGDFLAHTIAYAIFGFTLAAIFAYDDKNSANIRILVPILLGVLYGITDEYHQSFVSGRQSTVSDIIANGLGVALGVYACINFAKLCRGLGTVKDDST